MRTIKLLLKAVMLALALSFVFLPRFSQEAEAITAGELKNVEVVSHYFTTSIITDNRMQILTKDTSSGRYLVMKLSAISPSETILFADDFALAYSRGSKSEERADCDAIGIIDVANDAKSLYAGNSPRIIVGQGKVNFMLVFWIEPDVNEVIVHRVNGSGVKYNIGTDRPYSVYITTNTGSDNVISEAVKIIKDGDYDVVSASNGLIKDEDDIIIHYNEKAESAAREISQRLMTKFNFIPKLEKMKLITEFDIVIWLGQASSRKKM